MVKHNCLFIAHQVVYLLVLVGVVLLGASPVLGQAPDEPAANSDTGYSITWWTVDNGGNITVGSGDYTLSSTAGQPEAVVVAAGDYTLSGGFWGGGALGANYTIYLPIIARSSS
jgi:hypothetical protein